MDRYVKLLREILSDGTVTQRGLAEKAGLSLGGVNLLIKKMKQEGLITESCGGYMKSGGAQFVASDGRSGLSLTKSGREYLERFRVEGAVILAAGFGTRFVPLSLETPKGLIRVFGEPMIEREILQLHEAGIRDIVVVTGYMKESFEYLTDLYGVKLLFNPDFEKKNNLSSLYAARDFVRGRNIYLLASDFYMEENIFHTYEPFSWYAARHIEGPSSEWVLLTDKKNRILDTYPGGRDQNFMYGPAYFSREFSDAFMPVLELMYEMPGTEDYFWENVLMDMLNKTAEKRIRAYFGEIPAHIEVNPDFDIEIYMRLLPEGSVREFESLEELREFDKSYMTDSGSEAMRIVSSCFGVPESMITGIQRLKAGMTNNSWLFSLDGKAYICRVPGAGSNILINRHEEKMVYDAIAPLSITENLIRFDEETGYKISEYFENSRTADPESDEDMLCCMKKLRSLHESGVKVPFSFDIGEKISFYEELCGGPGKVFFSDYMEMSERKDRVLAFVESLGRPIALSHIDSVHDNFLFVNGDDLDSLRLIDWEYAGMCDPFVDIAMCAIYSFRDEYGALKLLKFYLGREPADEERLILYAYMALGGLLWSLWGVFKETKGVLFTDYTIRMYRYFKEYSVRLPLS